MTRLRYLVQKTTERPDVRREVVAKLIESLRAVWVAKDTDVPGCAPKI